MSPKVVFDLMTPFGLVVFLLIGFWYVRPRLYGVDFHNALIPLLLFSTFRYLGALFVVPELSNGLADTVFAAPAARGDLVVSVIALVAALALRMGWVVGVPLAWAYAVLGSLDFVFASYLGSQSNFPEHAGALWPILLLGGPSFIAALVLLFAVLLKHPTRLRTSARSG